MDSEEQAQRTQYWAELPACSNEMFADLDEWIARAVLSQARDTLHDLDEEMAQVKKAGKPLRALIERHSLASERVDKLAVGVAPHKRLPPEVLSQIFIHAMEGKELTVPSFTRQVPGILGRVCSQWRAVARGEPRLWNRIRICSRFSPSALGVIRAITSRSGCLPMSITIDGKRWSASKVLETLGSLSHRIHALEIPIDLESSEVLGGDPYSFVQLKTLHVIVYRTVDELRVIPTTVTAFASSEKLRCLNVHGTVRSSYYLEGIPFDCLGFDATSLPWHQLSDLEIKLDSPFPKLAMVLQWCKSLVKCVVSATAGESSTPYSECTLKRLRLFTIRMDLSSDGLDAFLAHLICPALEVLKVRSEGKPSFLTTWTDQDRGDFLLRSPKVCFV